MPNPSPILAASHRALLASLLLHGAGITTALVLALPSAGPARWRGARAVLLPPPVPVAAPRADADAPAITAEPSPAEVALIETELLEAPWSEPPPAAAPPAAPRRTPALADWRATLRAPADAAVAAPVVSPAIPAVAATPPSPLPGHNEPPRYPSAARHRGIEGTVVIELDVGPDGAVTAATVAVSSGSPLLDEAARRQLLTWRFAPARGASGPVRGTHRQDVIFRLRD